MHDQMAKTKMPVSNKALLAIEALLRAINLITTIQGCITILQHGMWHRY